MKITRIFSASVITLFGLLLLIIKPDFDYQTFFTKENLPHLLLSVTMIAGGWVLMYFTEKNDQEAVSQDDDNRSGYACPVNDLSAGTEFKIAKIFKEDNEAIISYLNPNFEITWVRGEINRKLIPDGATIGTVCVTVENKEGDIEFRIVEQKKSS